MTEQKNNKKFSMGIGCVLIRIAAVLFCLVVVSTYLMSGLFARYVSNGNGGDSARVAGFNVVMSSSDVKSEVTALEPGTITISLANQSEVAVSYTIRVDVGSPAGGVKITWVDPDHDVSTADDKIQIENDGVAENNEKKFDLTRYMPVGGTDTCTLTFTAVDWTKITQGETGTSATLTQEFTVYVDVVQVD